MLYLWLHSSIGLDWWWGFSGLLKWQFHKMSYKANHNVPEYQGARVPWETCEMWDWLTPRCPGPLQSVPRCPSSVQSRQSAELQVCSFRSRGGSWPWWAAGGRHVPCVGQAGQAGEAGEAGGGTKLSTTDWEHQDAVTLNTILITRKVNHQRSTISLKRFCWSVYIKPGNYLIISYQNIFSLPLQSILRWEIT